MKKYIIFILTCLSLPLFANASLEYTVIFSGAGSEDTLKLLNSASELVELKEHPPKTETALKRRIEEDIPNLIKALHSKAYYNAKIDYSLDSRKSPIEVKIIIDPGTVYPLAEFRILPEGLCIKPEQLGISLHTPALPKDLLQAQDNLLLFLENKGYPVAKIESFEAVADQTSKELRVTVKVDTGPLATFGPITIEGNESVRQSFIRKKIKWKEGDVYSPEKIENTIEALEAARLFSSINIIQGQEVNLYNQLPVTIALTEGKHRTVGFGLGYSTQRGPGVTGEWEHRNLRGKGERVRFIANILKETQDGIATYIIPDFKKKGQDLVWSAEVEHEDTKGYETSSFSLSSTLERQVTKKLRFSYGLMYEHIKTKGEHKNGSKSIDTDNLIKTPFQIKWTNVDDTMDPTSGGTLYFKAVPSAQLLHDPFFYTITSLTASFYKPLSRERRFVLAAKLNVGTILGASRKTIPEPERFFAGSENTLRGYSYKTVSPLSRDHDPIGGRSMLIGTLEGRWRINDNWGTVLFYDVGNVFSSPLPQLDKKMLQSVGMGVRYYTPVGPLRFDVAVPLNRRKHVDKGYQLYFSVGQSF